MSRRSADAALHSNTKWRNRSRFVLVAFVVCCLGLVWRAFELQVLDSEFLINQADARHLRKITHHAPRRAIVDRNDKSLAVSAPSASIWTNPPQLLAQPTAVTKLAYVLGKQPQALHRALQKRAGKQFMYLARQVSPTTARHVKSLKIQGVHVKREFQRFYPAGEVTAHVLGFTDIDDNGQEGLERSYDNHLSGSSARQHVKRDRHGNVIEVLREATLDEAEPMKLSIDHRIQYLAYRELKAVVQREKASGGAVVIVHIPTGQVLAMVNQPSFNPHVRSHMDWSNVRNRSVANVFEPGSTIKPLIMAAAIESGQFHYGSVVDTAPGRLKVGSHTIRDPRNYGQLDLTGIIRKSSNVGVSKIALALPPESLWGFLAKLGFGVSTASGLPGEVTGRLPHFKAWGKIGQATLAYGYGVSTTALQLAQAYAIIGSGGVQRPVTLLMSDYQAPETRMFRQSTAQAVVKMMEAAVGVDGTAKHAAIPGYRVAGKTGTVRKIGRNGRYTDDDYLALFAGLVPASNPQLAVVVMIDDPSREAYYGGEIAAPVFARILGEVLHILAIPPDALPQPVATAHQRSAG